MLYSSMIHHHDHIFFATSLALLHQHLSPCSATQNYWLVPFIATITFTIIRQWLQNPITPAILGTSRILQVSQPSLADIAVRIKKCEKKILSFQDTTFVKCLPYHRQSMAQTLLHWKATALKNSKKIWKASAFSPLEWMPDNSRIPLPHRAVQP